MRTSTRILIAAVGAVLILYVWRSRLDVRNVTSFVFPDTHISMNSMQRTNSFRKYFPWYDIAFKRVNGSWIADDRVCTSTEPFEEVMLKTPAGDTPIFIHDVKKSPYISKGLKINGKWEPDVMYTAYETLKENKEHVFVDIGGNVGVFSLAAAKLGNRVVAVEPFPENSEHLCRGVIKGGFSGRMFLVSNAVSNERGPISFAYATEGFGLQHTFKGSEGKYADAGITSILMPDLLEMFDIKSAVVKMDCERCEVGALKGAEPFFQAVDVRMVIIEWNKLYNHEGAPFVVDMMKRFGLIPFDLGKYDKPLNSSEYFKWKAVNVVFKKM